MSMFLLNNFQPRFLFDEDNGDGGSSGGDDNTNPGDDNGGDDKGHMLDRDKIMGGGDKPDDDGDGDKPDDKPDDKQQKAERPEYIQEKFWDPEKGEIRTESMAKAYKDLEKKLGKNSKAPDEYKLELNEDLEKIFDKTAADDDPLLKWFKGYAQKNNFSQEMFTEMLQEFGKEGAEMLAANAVPPIDPKEEMQKLGKNAHAIVENQTKFLGQLFKQGHVNEAQMQEILILTETAEGINALQAIRNYYGDQNKIPLNLTSKGGVKSSTELQTLLADPKYGNDKEYTDMVDKEYEKKYGKGTSGQSQRTPLY